MVKEGWVGGEGVKERAVHIAMRRGRFGSFKWETGGVSVKGPKKK